MSDPQYDGIAIILIVFNLAVIFGAIARAIKFCLAWYFAFHFVKKFKRLPAHMRPPGWSRTNL